MTWPSWDRLRQIAPWIARDILRVVLVALLAAVSAYYLFRWAVANQIPPQLAWTLPVLADASALLGIVVAKYPRDERCRRKAVRFAWTAALVSSAGNAAMHAVDFQALQPGLFTVVVTGALYPVFLAWGVDVAGGMALRPAPVKTEQRDVPEPVPAVVTATPPPEQPQPATPTPPAAIAEQAVECTREQMRTLALGAAARWGEKQIRSGSTAGKKRMLSQYPQLSEHFADLASTEAKRLAEQPAVRAVGSR